VPYISGTLTIGRTITLDNFNGIYNLTYDNGRIEDSLVFCYSRPSIYSLISKGNTATGNITTSLNNLVYTVSQGPTINEDLWLTGWTYRKSIAVSNTYVGSDLTNFPLLVEVTSSGGVTDFLFEASVLSTIASKNDAGANFSTCTQPLILSINGVPPDTNGNITIYSIHPVTLTISAEFLVMGMSQPLAEFCPINNTLPPVPDLTTQDYYAYFVSTLSPEWQDWIAYGGNGQIPSSSSSSSSSSS
jgi:hypothetical protein